VEPGVVALVTLLCRGKHAEVGKKRDPMSFCWLLDDTAGSESYDKPFDPEITAEGLSPIESCSIRFSNQQPRTDINACQQQILLIYSGKTLLFG
jgi:hypothetical protein